MNTRRDPRVTGPGPGRFLALVVCLTWVCWIPAIQAAGGSWQWAVTPLVVLGGAMPLLASAIVVQRSLARVDREEFWARVVDGRRISGVWWALTLLLAPAITALAGILDVLAGGAGAGLGEPAVRAAAQPVTLIPFLFLALLFGPIPEEIAWRGYALDRMLEASSAILASVAIWAVWAAWHLPLFWIEGTYQHGLGVGTAEFWLFLGEMLPRSLIMTWIFLNTSRSTLAMILFHLAVNVVGELFEVSRQGEVFRAALWCAVALLVLWRWGLDRVGPAAEEGSAGSGGHPRAPA